MWLAFAVAGTRCGGFRGTSAQPLGGFPRDASEDSAYVLICRPQTVKEASIADAWETSRSQAVAAMIISLRLSPPPTAAQLYATPPESKLSAIGSPEPFCFLCSQLSAASPPLLASIFPSRSINA